MNNKIFSRMLCLFICFSLGFSANAKVVAAISTMKGLVMVKPVGSRKYIPAYKGQMLKSGEWLKTKDGVFVAIVFITIVTYLLNWLIFDEMYRIRNNEDNSQK